MPKNIATVFVNVFLGVILLYACKGYEYETGDLHGVKTKRWFSERPYGMSLIPQGVAVIGKTSPNKSQIDDAPSKTVSISAFYMDDTEITNAQYRQFVYWVRDSILRHTLAEIAEQKNLTPRDKKTTGEYAYIHADTSKAGPYHRFMKEAYPTLFGKKLNWDIPLQWKESNYPDEDYANAVEELYQPLNGDSTGNARVLKTEELKFSYVRMSAPSAQKDSKVPRKPFHLEEKVKVYPDTLVWIKEFNYAYLEPRHNEYFYHVTYRDYPVVGVDWYQAQAFCIWRGMMRHKTHKIRGQTYGATYRLPTEAEWEYAASGGKLLSKFPWGTPSLIDKNGCYLANFKPLRADYSVDGGVYTTPVKFYKPNHFNLYDMAGNVSEWTSSDYFQESYYHISEVNPNMVGKETHTFKAVRGGSWKDIAYYLEISTRDYEHVDSARSYIGFRTVEDVLGSERMFENPRFKGKKAPMTKFDKKRIKYLLSKHRK